MFPLKREIDTRVVVVSLASLLKELKQLSHGGGTPVGLIDNQVRWLKIDLEFIDLKEDEDWILDARRIVYDAEQFIWSCYFPIGTEKKKTEVVSDMMRRYCRMVANYQRNNNFNVQLGDLLATMQEHAGFVDDDETKGSIFGHHLSDWIEGDQDSSTIASGGRVVGVTGDDNCFIGLDEQVDLLLPNLVNEGGAGGAYRFISLWGMGGLGKTAIAKAIYKHPDVRGHFRHFSWVSMPNDRSNGDILHGILDDLLPGWQRSAKLGYNMSKKKSAEEDQKKNPAGRENTQEHTVNFLAKEARLDHIIPLFFKKIRPRIWPTHSSIQSVFNNFGIRTLLWNLESPMPIE
ncbi:hypothetical protein LguiB_026732 [Lonicera macranthoides]